MMKRPSRKRSSRHKDKDLQGRFLVIVACMTPIFAILTPTVYLVVFFLTKNPYVSLPPALFPGGMTAALGFVWCRMALRIFPKTPGELHVDEIKALHQQKKVVP